MNGRSIALSLPVALASACIVLVACRGPGAGGGAPARPDASHVTAQLAGMQRHSLPGLHRLGAVGAVAVRFEARSLERGAVLTFVPQGWRAGVVPGSFDPPAGAGLGFETRLMVATNCDFGCEPKDWSATAERVEFAVFRNADQFDIEREEVLRQPAGKLLVATPKGGRVAYITVARWREGAERYLACRATLAEAALPLKAAFVQLCLEARETEVR